MKFGFDEDQLALAATVRDVLRTHCPPAALRTARRPAWDQLAGLGFFGLLLPEEADGLGLALVDVLPALEETGRACLPGPVVETAVVAPSLLAGVPKLASGAVCVGVLAPGQAYAADADLADLLIVVRDGAARVVHRADLRLEPRRGVDPARPLFEVRHARSEPLPAPVGPALVRGTVATAAQLVGVARQLLSTAVAYARVRTQFGAPIGSFQAVKHQLADVAVAVEFAAPLVYRAALTLESDAAERDASAAKAAAGEAATLAARVALQVHGAIGYTEELDLRFWLARAWSLSMAYGTTAAHRERLRAAIIGRRP
ncbi:acyl-CoA/acyl-ACP dehydrogenase [Nonomuraea sp. FMUSA5-5]|uniref:Acyl-CoA/acyl-ACP dehydrogenase n=1 Tax=Nonomuraea composti TaxID=2720023 RepID=A0ABX1BD36_9ACTN|nr:acyl-CoA dehydrogenase family protein [Nonomuraea sp. FMUSA5-5]NJP94417.1 acyl-CoA/acyl-ACP dehydrogenase [Nonomuraea sp. FMUSA5-5]